jgi:hypothetical protein
MSLAVSSRGLVNKWTLHLHTLALTSLRHLWLACSLHDMMHFGRLRRAHPLLSISSHWHLTNGDKRCLLSLFMAGDFGVTHKFVVSMLCIAVPMVGSGINSTMVLVLLVALYIQYYIVASRNSCWTLSHVKNEVDLFHVVYDPFVRGMFPRAGSAMRTRIADNVFDLEVARRAPQWKRETSNIAQSNARHRAAKMMLDVLLVLLISQFVLHDEKQRSLVLSIIHLRIVAAPLFFWLVSMMCNNVLKILHNNDKLDLI